MFLLYEAYCQCIIKIFLLKILRQHIILTTFSLAPRKSEAFTKIISVVEVQMIYFPDDFYSVITQCFLFVLLLKINFED